MLIGPHFFSKPLKYLVPDYHSVKKVLQSLVGSSRICGKAFVIAPTLTCPFYHNTRRAMPPKQKYTDPKLRDEVKEDVQQGDKGGAPGQWSARKVCPPRLASSALSSPH